MTADTCERRHAGLSRAAAAASLLLIAAACIGGAALSLPPAPYSHLFHDELHYAQQARDIAEGGFPRYNRDCAPKYPPLYGAALAPVRAAAGPDGFAWWARLLNVALAVSALVPAYRLARLTLPRGWAIAAAGLSLIGAYQVYTRLLLSENLFTPLFLWCTVALVRVCRRPTAGRALTAGLLLGFAALTKSLIIVLAPAVVIAVIWSVRAAGPILRTCAGIAAGAAIPLLAWRCRGVFFPSERDLLQVFSYWNEFAFPGLRKPADYLHWIRVESGAWVAAVAAPAVALATAGLVTRLFGRRPADRSFAAFALLAGIGVTVFTGIWMAQITYYKTAVHERYLVFLWPLVTIAFVDRLARPAGSNLALGAAVALAIALVAAAPAAVFDPGAGLGYLADFPSAPHVHRLFEWTGGANGVRIVLLLPLLGLPLLRLRRRAIGVAVVLALGTGFALHAAHAARAELKWIDRHVCRFEQPVLDWLATVKRPGDGILCHGPMWNLSYRICLAFDLPFSPVYPAGGPIWESAVEVDPKRGTYRYRGRPPAGRMLLLTRDPTVAPGCELASFEDFRLIELPGGRIPARFVFPGARGYNPDRE